GVVEDGQVVALRGPGLDRDPARRGRAGIEDEPEGIGARERHQRRGAGLVATGDDQHRVAVMGVVADLEAVGDGVARYQAVARRGRALRQRVGHRGGADDEALAAALLHERGEQVGQLADAIVAAVRIGPGGGDGDHRPRGGGAVRVEAGGAQLDPRALPEDAAVLRHDRSPASSTSRLTTTAALAIRMASSPRSPGTSRPPAVALTVTLP